MIETTTDVKAWVLGGVLAIAMPTIAYLISREFTRRDQLSRELRLITERFTLSINELNKVVAALALAVSEVKLWSEDRFVGRTEHVASVAAMKADIAEHAARFERELERCEARCPERCSGRD